MKNVPDSKEKKHHLYTEVRYAKNSSLSLKHNASVFKLKRNGRNLDSEEYGQNLVQYLSDARNTASLTVTDLQDVLQQILSADFRTSVSAPDYSSVDSQPVNSAPDHSALVHSPPVNSASDHSALVHCDPLRS